MKSEDKIAVVLIVSLWSSMAFFMGAAWMRFDTKRDLIERGVCVWSVDPQTGERELVANCNETENTDAD